MLSIWYERYKQDFWLILTLAFATGAVSKAMHGSKWEVTLNGGLAVVSCIIWLIVRLIDERKMVRREQQ